MVSDQKKKELEQSGGAAMRGAGLDSKKSEQRLGVVYYAGEATEGN